MTTMNSPSDTTMTAAPGDTAQRPDEGIQQREGPTAATPAPRVSDSMPGTMVTARTRPGHDEAPVSPVDRSHRRPVHRLGSVKVERRAWSLIGPPFGCESE